MKVKILAILFFSVLLSGCTSLIQKSGEFLDDSLSGDITVSVFTSDKKPKTEYRKILTENGDEGFIITSSAYPGLKFRGTRNVYNLFFTQIEFLSSHVHGWNEFTLAVIGRGSFYETGANGVLQIPTAAQIINISEGRIRYRNNRITDDAALYILRDRRERIISLTEWMNEYAVERGIKIQFTSIKEFEKFWKNILFPELTTRKNRPIEYSENNAEWITGNEIKWNSGYTKILFPDDMQELRNSGALLRDWEESISWIYLEYSWDSIAAFLNGQEFRRR